MKEQAVQIVNSATDKSQAHNFLREYLQHLLLRVLFELNTLNLIVFHGGTALRILHGLRRYSEDLDFHLKHADRDFSFCTIIDRFKKNMEKQGYKISIKKQQNSAVLSILIKFQEILYEAQLSPFIDENLNIKIEIDTNPPNGFKTDHSLVNKYFPFGIVHHDKSSFLSGKLHAVLQRSFTKGRDYYDLWFYLTRWKELEPNFIYLNNALKQTGFDGPIVTIRNWRDIIKEHLSIVDWEIVISDVEPFIASQEDLKIFSKEILLKILADY